MPGFVEQVLPLILVAVGVWWVTNMDDDVEAQRSPWRHFCQELASGPTETLVVNGTSYTMLECLAQAAADSRASADDWTLLSRHLTPKQQIPVRDENITKVTALVRALELQPSNWSNWFTLGAMLTPGKTIPAGELGNITNLGALVRALELNAEHEPSWFQLGTLLGKRAVIVNGTINVTALAAFTRAAELVNTTLATWGFLGSNLGHDEHVTVRGEVIKRKEAFARVVQIDATHAVGWLNLGAELRAPGETVEIQGTAFNQTECFIMCLRNNPKGIAGAWYNLGMVLPEGGVHVWPGLEESFIRNRTECFIRSVTIHHKQPQTWFALAESLSPETTVEVLGKPRSKVDCYGRAAALDPLKAIYWERLVEYLSSEEATVQVGDKVMTREQCRRAAEDLSQS